MHTFTLIFLTFLLASVLTRLWLSQRQINHILSHKDKVPEAFAEKISLEEHQKAADYSTTKLKLGRLTLAWETLWLLLWTTGGALSIVDSWWLQYEFSPLWTGIGVILSLTLLMSLLDLPFSLYSTFVIEERFGFNKTTIKTWITDLLKSASLMMVIGVPLIAVILWLMNQAGQYWWLYAWSVWTAFSLLMMWAFPVFIAPLFNKFSALEDESLKTRIDNLLQRCGFKSKGVFVVDGSKRSAHGNAYFTGFGSNKRIVFYDTLLESLSENEVEAVLAHELGHFKRNHIKKSLALSILMTLGGFALLAWLMNSAWFYSAMGVETASTHTALLLFMFVLPVFTYFISPLFSAMSRKHEFEADDFAKQQSDYRALVSALVNMYRENASTLTPDPIHSMFYDSHPPASIRISHLESN
ncbi:MAG: M48 family metallopeptidase [Gammaproteobacteria bacterium]|jgi:STE24 endopeptidase|nr:M48 family metallopeptidase [Gammaproteobacteria bacterium]MBT4195170.1 M48 family metallopeptidase [Gammaproteobacteria bacterium]MBT4451792.1 M48 family metallopeptidase [Gammaproteobacteria bacterium]MBT6455228.1 M48 family metallopeptidase [Gammaproteobacteria bacterium]MBT6553672.1 M48 family metallopeptidase [Gammaproteobacteria bacterium]